MLRLSCQIEILHDHKKITFPYVSEVSVNTSIENYTDTCTVKLPKKIKFQNKNATEYIANGDQITVKLGYNDDLKIVFKGYITKINIGLPIVLECENEAYMLKRLYVKEETIENFDLQKFCKEYLDSNYLKEGNIDNVTLQKKKNPDNTEEKKILFKETQTFTAALDYLKKEHDVKQYFYFTLNEEEKPEFYGKDAKSPKLRNDAKTITFGATKNIISMDKLEYLLGKEVQVIARGISQDSDGKDISLEEKHPVGVNAPAFYLPAYNYHVNKEFLQDKAKAEYKNLSSSKITGEFTAFGIPFVRKGDVIKFSESDIKAIDGKTIKVKGVTYTFGKDGYRQKIQLGEEVKEK